MRNKILATILAFVLISGSCTEVFAVETVGTTVANGMKASVSGGDVQTENAEAKIEECDESATMSPEEWEALNDPLYSRYMYGINLMAEVSSASEITHDSRFDKYDKIMGIDVSKWQGDIDWSAVKNDGIDFAIIRLGYRGMQEGTLYTDPYFATNMEGAHAAGVSVGAYFFTQAITVDEAEEEAEYVVEQLKKYKSYVNYPVIIDIEAFEGSRLDAALLSAEQKTEICQAFCEIIEDAGYTAGVYSNKYYWETYLNAAELEDYYVWMANYTDQTSYAGRYDMWQFSSTGSVSGISGNVDLDVAYLPTVPGTPQELTQTARTTSSITLAWKSVANADGYKVYCYNANGKKIKTYEVMQAGITIDKLTPGTVYQYKVVAFYKNTVGTYTYGKQTDYYIVATKPEKVEGLETTAINASSVKLSWTKQSNVSGYRVYYYDASGKSLGSQDTTANSLEYSGLKSGVTYQFKVRSYVKANTSTIWGNYSEVLKVTTKPAQVTGLKLSSAGTSKLVVKWSKVIGAEGYKVYLYNDVTGKKTVLGTTSDTSYTIKNLEAGTPYSVSVAAYVTNSGKAYVGSYSTRLKTATKPEMVTNVKLKTVSDNSVSLNWTQQSNVTGYRVYCYDASGKSLGFQDATTNSLKYTGLKSGVTYQFKVCSYIEVTDTKTWGNKSAAITARTKPGKITNLKLGSATTNKLVVKWSAVTGAEGYKVCLYNEKTGKKTILGTTTNTSYTIKNLNEGTPYSVTVAAYVTNNDKEYIGSYSEKLKTATKPATVTNVKLNAVNPKSVKLSWPKQSNVSGYRVYCYDESGKLLGSQYSTTNSLKYTGLKEGVTYQFKVRSYVQVGSTKILGNVSSGITVTTKPAKVSNLKLSSATTNKVVVKWSEVEGAEGYKVYLYDEDAGKSRVLGTTTKRWYTIKNLDAGTEYSVKVAAYVINNKKEYLGAKSAALEITTKSK